MSSFRHYNQKYMAVIKMWYANVCNNQHKQHKHNHRLCSQTNGKKRKHRTKPVRDGHDGQRDHHILDLRAKSVILSTIMHMFEGEVMAVDVVEHVGRDRRGFLQFETLLVGQVSSPPWFESEWVR